MWEQIRANKRKSVVLIVMMAMILILLGYVAGEAASPGAGPFGVLVAGGIFLVQLLVYGLAAESVLLAGMGARELSREDSPRLFNIVEEMKLASGLTYLPKIYMIDAEAPNAFAIGRKPETSAVAVTSGLMHRLNRDELQGVVAHELGHLKNLDVRFMTLAGVMIGSIIICSDIVLRAARFGGRGSSRSDARSGGGGQAQILFVVAALALAVLGPLMARLLYFAVSRSREYLADASAAQFTRYPEGLASALLRIAKAEIPFPAANRATAPMFIINPLSAHAQDSGMFSSHPPTAQRVQILRSMGGASFTDYEAAFQSATGHGIIGPHTLSESAAEPKRAASDDGPVESKSESRNTMHRLHGYTEVNCPCGARMSAPSSFGQPYIVCIRCGTKNTLPTAKEMMPDPFAKAALETAEPSPTEYTRRQQSSWESFRCSCGGTVQLSPNFSAPMTQCPRCRRKILIH